LIPHRRWFSLGTPASSTTETGRHDIAEILLKVALNPNESNQINIILIQSNEPTMGKQLENFITCGCESSSSFFAIYKAGREPMSYW
jgi:hypothetical protein